MFARVGDWLIVESRSGDRRARRAQIMEVHSADGAPPYTVHWTDADREAYVFPGPDARVLTSDEVAERDRLENERVSKVQSALSRSGSAG